MSHRVVVCVTSLALLAGASVASAGERPPANSKTLAQIAAAVEQAGYGPLVEVSFDDGRWEVEAYQGDTKYELRVDPTSAEIQSKRVED